MGMGANLVMWPNSFVQIFIPFSHKISYEVWFQMTQLFLRKTIFNFEIDEWPLSKIKKWPWPLIFITLHLLIYLYVSINFEIKGCNSFQNINKFQIVSNLIWSWHKMSQGQPIVIILNNLGSTCLHYATYQVSKSTAYWFWRRRFCKVFTVYRCGGHVGHVTKNIWTIFHSPDPWRLHMKFDYNRPSGFR